MPSNHDRPALLAYRATIRATGEVVGLYHVAPTGDSGRDRGKAYHLAYLDLRWERYPDARQHADVPGLSLRRVPSDDDYA